MKKIFLISILLTVGMNLKAQFQVGGGLGLQIPVGDFSNGYHPGFNIGATGKYFLNENMAVGANLFFNFFNSDKYQDYAGNMWRNHVSITTFTGLFQYYFSTSGKLKPYAGSDLGFYFWRTRFYNYWINPAGHHVYDYYIDNGTALGIAPTGGITYDISDKLVLDANLKFNLMLTDSGLNYFGINTGIYYKIGK